MVNPSSEIYPQIRKIYPKIKSQHTESAVTRRNESRSSASSHLRPRGIQREVELYFSRVKKIK